MIKEDLAIELPQRKQEPLQVSTSYTKSWTADEFEKKIRSMKKSVYEDLGAGESTRYLRNQNDIRMSCSGDQIMGYFVSPSKKTEAYKATESHIWVSTYQAGE